MEKTITEIILSLEKRIAALELLVQEQPMNIENLAKELSFYNSKASHKTE
jgi:predicted transcriptional regulator